MTNPMKLKHKNESYIKFLNVFTEFLDCRYVSHIICIQEQQETSVKKKKKANENRIAIVA
jgi:hypothetical protein